MSAGKQVSPSAQAGTLPDSVSTTPPGALTSCMKQPDSTVARADIVTICNNGFFIMIALIQSRKPNYVVFTLALQHQYDKTVQD
jgi:hypothetical protein